MQIIASHIVKLSAYIKLLLALFITLVSPTLFAHGVAEGDKGYIQEIYGIHVIPFI
ncbi:MAG: HupE/UreJ family protein, partial [Acinetobacter baumannii]|nr:HupE/UreJ family protein [Acinetobacter baumannii]